MDKAVTIKRLLIKPFRENLNVFASQYLCLATVDLVCNIYSGKILFAIERAGLAVAIAFFVTFIFGLFKPGKASKFIGAVFCILGATNVVVDIFSFKILGCNFSQDCLSAVAATNIIETKGFLLMYFDVQSIGASAIVLYAIWKCHDVMSGMKASRPGGILEWTLSLLTVFSMLLWGMLPKVTHEGMYVDKLVLLFSYKPAVFDDDSVREYEVQTAGSRPDCIVLVIGESFTRSHASTFGYERNTTPDLDSMAREGVVIPYGKAFSTWPRTVESMAMMLTSCTSDSFSADVWQKNDFLLDVMHSAGYRTFWISNQSSFGFGGNLVSKMAARSDSLVWMSSSKLLKVDFDECLLSPLESLVGSGRKDCFIVVHMQGQHEAFKDRYPSSFDKFKPDRALNRKSRLIAEYDNAVLYNDHVVSAIMETFSDRDAVVIYVPDHGLDVYESNGNFVGHARPSDPLSMEAGLKIPMYVFVSGEFSERHPSAVQMIRSASSEEFVTDQLMDYILEIAGVSSY